MKVELPKGTRDIPPEKKIVRDRIIQKIITVFQRYGFLPLETPSFERYEVLASKYTGGEEILKEIFTFYDQGKRHLALRYDLTVPLARYIAMNPTLKLPFKRYAIGRVYRDGPIKRGRLREFYQCDADIVGAKTMLADATILLLAVDVFQELGLPVVLKINNRKLMNGFLRDAGVSEEKLETTILSIDKLEKMGEEYVQEELREKGLDDAMIAKIFSYLQIKELSSLQLNDPEGQEGKQELEELFGYLPSDAPIVFDITLARGLAYYTGTVVEGFLQKELTSVAVCGGGRYDKMISNLLQSKQAYPAVGISFGLEVISEVVEAQAKTTTDIFVVPIGTVQKEALQIAQELRKKGLNVDIDLMKRGISKNLAYVNSYHIPYVLVVGEDELKQGKYQLKNMETGEQQALSIEEIVATIKNT